jgi:hypothetical protein
MRRSVLVFGAVAVLGVLARTASLPAQDKKPAPAGAEAPAQDRIEFSGSLDSWYKVLQKDNHIGYAHLVLDRVATGGAWRYTFNTDSEYELLVEDSKHPGKEVPILQSQSIRSKLDDTYAPIDWQESDHISGIDLNTHVSPDESGARKVEVVLSATDHRSFTVGSDEEVYYHPFLMFVALRQNGHLAKPGARKVGLLWPNSEGRPPTVEVSLEVGAMVKRAYLEKKDVPVTRVVFIKPPPARVREAELQEAFIDKYGRPVEWVTRGGMRTILVKSEEEAAGRSLVLRQGARRDPFRKDLAMRGIKPGDGQGTDREKKEHVTIGNDPGSFEKTLTEAKKLLEELRKAKEEDRQADGETAYQRLLDYYEALTNYSKEHAQAAASLQQVEEMHRQSEEIWGGRQRLMLRLELVYNTTMMHFNRDECPDMEKGLEELKKNQDRKELKNTQEQLKVAGWIAKVEPLVAKCKTRLELARKKIVLTGTISYEDWQQQPVDMSVSVFGHQAGGSQTVRFIKPSRMAVINEKIYRIGDMVESEGVRVDKIWPNGVQVSLRDETRDVGMRQ